MYQLTLTGGAYEEDSKVVYHLLKSFLVNMAGWTWLESFDVTEHGYETFQAWTNHYNG